MNDIFPSIKEIERAMCGGGGSSHGLTKHRRFAYDVIAILVSRGWSSSFVTHAFRFLDDRHVGSHRPLFFVEEWAKFRAYQSHASTFATILRQIGVRPQVISILERRIYTSLVNTCYTEAQLADIAIEYLLRRRVPITSPDPMANVTHPFHPEITHRWYTLDSILESSTLPTNLVFRNFPFRCSQRKENVVNTLLSTLPLTNYNPDTHVLHYHTTSWDGANRILQTAINHSAGRSCLDFGLEPAFYLSQNIKDALGWGYSLGQSRSDHEVAILVFSLPRTGVDTTFRIKHLRGDEWTHITRESRRCRRPLRISRDAYYEIPEIRNYDFLYGHMVANVEDIHSYDSDPLPHDPPKTQLASKTTRGDMFLQTHIACCIFFQKYIPTGHTANRRTRKTRRV